MSDYIKREDALFIALQQPLYSVVSQIKQLDSIDLADYVPKDFHDKTCEAMAKRHQEEIADMESVVRCKECRYCLVGVATAQYSNGKQRIENLCEKHKWSVRADDFCSYGERKVSEKPTGTERSRE